MAINVKPLSEVDAFLDWEGLTPESAEDRPEFYAASDAARELPPKVTLGNPMAHPEGTDTGG